MATIAESNANMTVFYNKRLGTIVSIASGIQNFNTYFGAQAQDFALIWASVIMPFNQFVLDHVSDFIIQDGALKLVNGDLAQFI